jgi:hypothetical protein
VCQAPPKEEEEEEVLFANSKPQKVQQHVHVSLNQRDKKARRRQTFGWS